MMWYEPYANPGDWALAKKDNIKELVSHWHNCKYPNGLFPYHHI